MKKCEIVISNDKCVGNNTARSANVRATASALQRSAAFSKKQRLLFFESVGVNLGLDYAQKYRNMPYIGVLKPEVYSK